MSHVLVQSVRDYEYSSFACARGAGVECGDGVLPAAAAAALVGALLHNPEGLSHQQPAGDGTGWRLRSPDRYSEQTEWVQVVFA